jgi:hypothetical protein
MAIQFRLRGLDLPIRFTAFAIDGAAAVSTILIFDRVAVVPNAATQSGLPATRTYLLYKFLDGSVLASAFVPRILGYRLPVFN